MKLIKKHQKGGNVDNPTVINYFKNNPNLLGKFATQMQSQPQDTIVDVVEPFLLKIGFLKRTPRGRELTRSAYEHMGFSRIPKEIQKEMF